MTYDLRRLRLHGIIERDTGHQHLSRDPDGIRVPVFYTKLDHRLLNPCSPRISHPAPLELRRALSTIDRCIEDYVTNARLGAAA